MASTGFRRVPNWLFFNQMRARRESGTPWNTLEAWCSLDYDLYSNHQLGSERAYAKQWKRSRGWVHGLMRLYREEHDLPESAIGRRPRANGAVRAAPGHE